MNKVLKLGKKVSLVSFLLFTLSIIFSCDSGMFPTDVIEVKNEKGEKIKIFSLVDNKNNFVVDKNENVYFVDENMIKKVDSKGNLTIIVGKKEPDILPNDGNIDGDIKTAKFGQISNLQYIEEENALYFFDNFLDKDRKILYTILRKYYDNKFETKYTFFGNENFRLRNIKNINKDGFYYYMNKNSEIYIFGDKNNKEELNWIALSINKVSKSEQLLEYQKSDSDFDYRGAISYFITDNSTSNNIIYFLNNKERDESTELYIKTNSKWKKILDYSKIGRHRINISIDKNDNLYIIEDTLLNNIEGVVTNPSQLFIYKIPKKDVLEANGIIDIKNKNYLVGELSIDSYISISDGFTISEDGKYLYGFFSNTIKKIYLGGKK